MHTQLRSHIQMFCNITAAPDPVIKWYKDEVELIEDTRIVFFDGMKSLKIFNSTIEDSGEYKCVGKNRFGEAEKLIILKVTGIRAMLTKISIN